MPRRPRCSATRCSVARRYRGCASQRRDNRRMTWRERLDARLNFQASQAALLTWLAFAILALSLALGGLPRYVDLLHAPCAGAGCFGAQLPPGTAQTWIAMWG